MVHSTRRFVLSLTLCYFVHVLFNPFSIAITSLGEERDNLSAFRTFVWFALVCFYLFPLPLGVWGGLRLVIVALPGLFSYLFFFTALLHIYSNVISCTAMELVTDVQYCYRHSNVTCYRLTILLQANSKVTNLQKCCRLMLQPYRNITGRATAILWTYSDATNLQCYILTAILHTCNTITDLQ